MLLFELPLDRCSVRGQSLTASGLIRFQVLSMYDSEKRLGLLVTEYLTVEGVYDPGHQYEIKKVENMALAEFKVMARHYAKNTVVTVVDAMEAVGLDGRATFERGSSFEEQFPQDDGFTFKGRMESCIVNKPLMMEIRAEFLDERLSEAYDSWGAW